MRGVKGSVTTTHGRMRRYAEGCRCALCMLCAQLYRRGNERIKHTDRKKWLKAAYGLSVEQYDELFRMQGFGCAICHGLNKDGRRLSVDHDHSNGDVRGLLCMKCNTQLGWYEKYQRQIGRYL